MDDIKKVFSEAARFKETRRNLAKKIKDVDERYAHNLETIDSIHLKKVNDFEMERQAAFSLVGTRLGQEVAGYTHMKNSLQQYIQPVRQWCTNMPTTGYVPNPLKMNEEELNKLVLMLQEQGLVAWIKRTFKLDGYSSRSEMAWDLYKKIEDACAYCNEKIYACESKAENMKNEQMTETRRKIDNEQERYVNEKYELQLHYKAEKEKILKSIKNFDDSKELSNIHKEIENIQLKAENSCGNWGEYKASDTMPEKVLLCETSFFLPNINGIEEKLNYPIWLDLFESNIIVITMSSRSKSNLECEEKLIVRKLLARMLKTIPPEYCSYSVFDSLHKGSSLGRLIDITNVGTTDLNFDLFTSDEKDDKNVTCAERRKYLRNRPADIIKYMAGRSNSLFEYNKAIDNFEFPFSWYIDFDFPENPDNKMVEDIKELFINAHVAGYSFVFVTTSKGFDLIRNLAELYTDTHVIHIDIESKVCEKAELSVEYIEATAPNTDQIYNFVSALKKYYVEGNLVSNRIDSVFLSKGLELRNAAKQITIPMATDSRGRLVDLELGGEGSVHGFISGGTNSGKSTLLHTIILSACLHYHPKDLEIWLVDYKQTEFHLYKKKTPPHIKLIGVSKTADFTFSLLDRIENEANHRTELMNRFDSQNLEDYRKHEGQNGYVNIPRLFIIIDEFHEMSQFVATEVEYKDKLENILREYRAQGITCLMADQTFSTGLSGLTSAAKNQIGLRIAMRNEASPQEIKDTLEVDRALYSDSMQHTISIMSQGEFIMKVYVRNKNGDLTDIKLEKFKGLYTKGDDIAPISKALAIFYKGQYTNDLLYVNTKEIVSWSEDECASLDQDEPLRYPNIRLYLGRSATLKPCFGLDLGRQPDENLSIVGGTARQRWELLASIIKSCKYKNYKLIVFAYEFSDLMNDFGDSIQDLCSYIPNSEFIVSIEAWCKKLEELEMVLDERRNIGDTICMFIGLEIANIEMERMAERTSNGAHSKSFSHDILSKYLVPRNSESEKIESVQVRKSVVFNAMPIIDKLFSTGARNGARCVAEVSVYRQFSKILKIKDMCRHKIAFSMSADDCLMYLGNSNFQKNIEQNAIYSDGGKEVKKLIPYK